MVVATWEADIFPTFCHVRHDVLTLDGALHYVAVASSSLPTVESEMYSSMGGAGATCMSATLQTL
jgi:hypothetical protein